MRYLLDTQMVIWSTHDVDVLPKKAKDIIADPKNELYVSYASLWEITIKQSLKKLTLKGSFYDDMQKQNDAQLLPISTHHLQTLLTLPHHHKDPFDRLLIAQAIAEKLTLLTSDKQLRAYKTKIILA